MGTRNYGIIAVSLASFAIFLGLGRWVWVNSLGQEIPAYALAASNRMAIAILMIITTTTAFVLTLTSQLYTPKLIKLFVQSPVVFFSYNTVVFANLAIVLTNLIQPGHPWYQRSVETGFILTCFVLAGTIPLLYQLTNYLRPDYFLPLLESTIQTGLEDLAKGKLGRNRYLQVIENWDVICNIALTAIKRDDRQLIRLAIRMLDKSLHHLLTTHSDRKSLWRSKRSFFVPGLTEEGCLYLKYTKCWPEAYVLYKKVLVLCSVTTDQNEVIAYACKNLHNTFQVAAKKDMDDVLELHLMLMNSLMRNSLNHHNIQMFQTLSYHYRINIGILKDKPYHLKESFASWSYYGKSAYKDQFDFAFETIMYDLGKLLVSLFSNHKADKSPDSMYQQYCQPLWKEAFSMSGRISEVAWRAVVKTFWEARILNLTGLASSIEQDFLSDRSRHQQVFQELSSFNSPLGWELKDRLLSFTYIGPATINEAREYFSEPTGKTQLSAKVS